MGSLLKPLLKKVTPLVGSRMLCIFTRGALIHSMLITSEVNNMEDCVLWTISTFCRKNNDDVSF
jgi:hypothetical protein